MVSPICITNIVITLKKNWAWSHKRCQLLYRCTSSLKPIKWPTSLTGRQFNLCLGNTIPYKLPFSKAISILIYLKNPLLDMNQKEKLIRLRLRLFAGKWIPFEKWIPGKYFPMFGSVMENELENNLLMNYYFLKFI